MSYQSAQVPIKLGILAMLMYGCGSDSDNGTGTVSCLGEPLLTDVGWNNTSARRQLGDIFIGEEQQLGGEPCISMHRLATIGGASASDEPTGALQFDVSRGLAIQFSANVPAQIKSDATFEFVEQATLELTGPRMTWLENPKAAIVSSSAAGDFLFELSLPNRFGFIVSRVTAADTLSLGTESDQKGTIEVDYAASNFKLTVEYACETQLSVNENVPAFFDGVFVELIDGYLATKTGVPPSFCDDRKRFLGSPIPSQSPPYVGDSGTREKD